MIQLTLRDQIKEAQDKDTYLQKIKAEVGTKKGVRFEVFGDKTLTFKGRLYVSKDEKIRNEILKEPHSTPYAPHPSNTKTYQNL